ncbi:hypothetical protein BC828DRAFT_239582 [Blastocladiella britannica]|nr:hypothetical protein BC828DRAFT_239582 [Blastocladiella britannica]
MRLSLLLASTTVALLIGAVSAATVSPTCGAGLVACSGTTGCCSQFGYCGSTSAYCAAGSCQPRYSKLGACAAGSSDVCGAGKPQCPTGQCCSRWGYCGVGTPYCGTGCQALYSSGGTCSPGSSSSSSSTTASSTTTSKSTTSTTSSSTTTTSTTSTTSTSTSSSTKTTTTTSSTSTTTSATKTSTSYSIPTPSPTGTRCGDGKGSCPIGQCCGSTNRCGVDASFCDSTKGCQVRYGLCSNAATISTDSQCVSKDMVAFSFDDGPWDNTPLLLSKFEAAGGKVTLFTTGNYDQSNCVYDRASTLIRAKANGHQIAHHTWTHPDLTASDQAGISLEVGLQNLALRKILGITPRFLRPPFGRTNPETEENLRLYGIAHISKWDLDTLDWDFENTPLADQEAVLDTASTTTGHLFVSHDMIPTTPTQLVDYMINWAKSRKLRMVTVGECVGDMNFYHANVTTPETINASWYC